MPVHSVTQAILDDNRGRDTERLRLKLAAMRTDAFAFFRGTSALYYRTLRLKRSLLTSPPVLACGDLHPQNFGSYKGDNRLVYFDLNDFDEACVAPLAYELSRFVSGLLAGAKVLQIGDKLALRLAQLFIETYAANVIAQKPRWVERPLATGPVGDLLRSLRGRHRRDFIKTRTRRKAGKLRLIIDGRRTLAASKAERERAAAILSTYADTRGAPAFFEPIDIARRIAGTGSLGLERYVALVRGSGGAQGQYLIDIKRAEASVLAACIRTRQPRWAHEAQRVATLQGIVQGISPALLGAAEVGKRSYLIKEMQPTADRVNLFALNGKAGTLTDVIRTMAQVTAWGHLRGCSRHGAASVDALAEFAERAKWRRQTLDGAREAAQRMLRHWQRYAQDYDADARHLLAAERGDGE